MLTRGMHSMKRRVLLDVTDQYGAHVELEDIDAQIDKAVTIKWLTSADLRASKGAMVYAIRSATVARSRVF